MRTTKPAKVVAIGMGPFNLGLAALAHPVPDVSVTVLESTPSFCWHPGMMLDNATIQVPFMADLVTMADPTSPYSFMNYLKTIGRIYPFYIRESFFPLRREYSEYCAWVADQLPQIHFGYTVCSVERDGCHYRVTSVRDDGTQRTDNATHLVIGVGTAPSLPEAASHLQQVDTVVHSANYQQSLGTVDSARRLAIVGSGQSAAEVFYDQLTKRATDPSQHVTWVTRSPRFFPMEYTKLTLEMTSPDFTRYFHRLPMSRRDELNREQRHLYKGISADLINDIYDTMYQYDVAGRRPATLMSSTSVIGGSHEGLKGTRLTLRHNETGEQDSAHFDAVVFATGYTPRPLTMLEPLHDEIVFDPKGRPAADLGFAIDASRHRIFIQNGEEHTHGLTAPDLGMGAYRNSVILNAIAGREVYSVEHSTTFQQFGSEDEVSHERLAL